MQQHGKRLVGLLLLLFMVIPIGCVMPARAESSIEDASVQDGGPAVEYVPGVVQSVSDIDKKGPAPSGLMSPLGTQTEGQRLKVLVTGGSLEGKTMIVDNLLGGDAAFDIRVGTGDQVLLYVEPGESKISPPQIYLADRYREPVILLLLGLVMLGYLVIGGRIGFQYLGLLLTLYITMSVFSIPQSLAGYGALITMFPAALSYSVIGTLLMTPHPRLRLCLIGCNALGLLMGTGMFTIAARLAQVTTIDPEQMAIFRFSHNEVEPLQLLTGSMMLLLCALLFTLTRLVLLPNALELDSALSFSEAFDWLYRRARQSLGMVCNHVVTIMGALALPWLYFWMESPFSKTLNLEGTSAFLIMILTVLLTLMLMLPITASIGSALRLWLQQTGPCEQAIKN